MAEDFVPLSHDLISAGLSELQRVVSGGFAFTKLDCSSKEPPITSLGNKIQGYTYLRKIVLSSNKITDIVEVSRLPQLQSLHLDSNEIKSAECLVDAELPGCQSIDLSNNSLEALPPLGALGRLRFLRLAGNQIASAEGFGCSPPLEELDLQGNQLTGLRGLGPLGCLRSLDLSGNQLATLEGLDAESLTVLNISKNQLATLEHMSGVPMCEDLDAGENELAAPAEADSLPSEVLRLSTDTPKLKVLTLAGNPVGDMRAEIICCLPNLRELNGEAVTDEDRQEAKERQAAINEAEEERAREAERREADGGGDEEGEEEEDG
eukprot:CAMPEP_0179243266 /NCGR_PEP_ID=MMETSP0797-20121207/17448_1 /TAXON_ID=47934 /ORGANISM="Dinophysis acuminata, Strain DAEP01" /LENGTH=320 /DNA_ID=CAMNT_0020950735 /DNA_START=73 /DNA_END=1035 /DNA_ORIENTATION=+